MSRVSEGAAGESSSHSWIIHCWPEIAKEEQDCARYESRDQMNWREWQ